LIDNFSMGAVATSPPNYTAAFAQNEVPRGPVVTSVGIPENGSLGAQVVGLMQAIYSYGGAMLYEIRNSKIYILAEYLRRSLGIASL